MPRNLPNWITGARLVLALLLFALLALVAWGRGASPQAEEASFAHWVASRERLLLNLCLAIFTLAAISDVLDGQIARRWDLQTDFGRIMDPFADKVIVCGAFIELVPLEGSQVSAWMVVVILARELLVDGLRGFAESKGVAFPSMLSGKLKMTFQCVCLMWILYAMANLPAVAWSQSLSLLLLILMLGMTVVSGVVYVVSARKVFSGEFLGTHTVGAHE